MVRVLHIDLVDADGLCRTDQHQDFRRTDVSSGQAEIVLRDDLEDFLRLRQQSAATRDRDSAGLALVAVFRVHRRHVHDLTQAATRQGHRLHRRGIHAAHIPVQDDAAEDLDARDNLRHQVSPGSSFGRVFLEHYPPHAVDLGDLGRLDSVELALEIQRPRLRRRVRMNVDDAREARCNLGLCEPPARQAEQRRQNTQEHPRSTSHRSPPVRPLRRVPPAGMGPASTSVTSPPTTSDVPKTSAIVVSVTRTPVRHGRISCGSY